MRSRPATEDKILRALSAAEVLCDDCLADLAAVRPRQQANKRARRLVLLGRVFREQGICPRCHHARIVNRLPSRITPRLPLGEVRRPTDGRPWFSAERLRDLLVDHLEVHGYEIVRRGGSVFPERVEARTPEGGTLWLFLRGHVERDPAHARREFATALLDLLLARESGVELGVALPSGFEAYRSLARNTAWLRTALPFRYFWIGASGNVTIA